MPQVPVPTAIVTFRVKKEWSAVEAGVADAVAAPVPSAVDAASANVGVGDVAVEDVDDHVAVADATACEQRHGLLQGDDAQGGG